MMLTHRFSVICDPTGNRTPVSRVRGGKGAQDIFSHRLYKKTSAFTCTQYTSFGWLWI